MSRFLTQILNDQPGEKATKHTEQLSTTPSLERSTTSLPERATTPPVEHATTPHPLLAEDMSLQRATHPIPPLATDTDSYHSTTLASDDATNTASRFPPASQQAAPRLTALAARKAASKKGTRVDSRRGDRHASNRVAFNNRLNADVVRAIKHFCIEQGMELQEFTELAAIHFIDHVASHQVGKSGSKQASEERSLMMLYKTTLPIINLYLQYNPENKWKIADDHEAMKYNDADIRLVEVGIIRTQFNAGFKKINSFKYYVTEIEETLAVPLGNDTIDIMLRRARERWQGMR